MSIGGVEHSDKVTTEGKPFCGDLARQVDTYWVHCVHTLSMMEQCVHIVYCQGESKYRIGMM